MHDENSYYTFGAAIELLKHGYRMSRKGWNGKGMWLSVSNRNSAKVEAANFWSPHNREYAEDNGGTATVNPCITMKTDDGCIQMGWAPSQQDMLTEDWYINEPGRGQAVSLAIRFSNTGHLINP